MVVKIVKVNYVGVAISVAMFASLLLPWWSIRADGASIDIYPYGVRAWSVTTYDTDWVVDSLLALDGTFLLVSLLVVVSGILTVAGSLDLKLWPLLIAPVVLNLTATFIFYGLMRSAIGKLALGYFSGTNLIPEGPWGFTVGIDPCVLAGIVAIIPLILTYLKRQKQRPQRGHVRL